MDPDTKDLWKYKILDIKRSLLVRFLLRRIALRLKEYILNIKPVCTANTVSKMVSIGVFCSW